MLCRPRELAPAAAGRKYLVDLRQLENLIPLGSNCVSQSAERLSKPLVYSIHRVYRRSRSILTTNWWLTRACLTPEWRIFRVIGIENSLGHLSEALAHKLWIHPGNFLSSSPHVFITTSKQKVSSCSLFFLSWWKHFLQTRVYDVPGRLIILQPCLISSFSFVFSFGSCWR